MENNENIKRYAVPSTIPLTNLATKTNKLLIIFGDSPGHENKINGDISKGIIKDEKERIVDISKGKIAEVLPRIVDINGYCDRYAVLTPDYFIKKFVGGTFQFNDGQTGKIWYQHHRFKKQEQEIKKEKKGQ